MRKIFKWLLILGAIALIAIQLVPVERSNPPVTHQPNWDSPETEAFARRACFDCHSNETVWPWYAHIAPVSWRVADHVRVGRRNFNMSEGKWEEPEEIVEEVAEGHMPLWDYVLMHPEAKLSAEEKRAFLGGLKKTFGGAEKAREREKHEEENEH